MILHYGDETLKIVEAFAEHDFCPLRLIEAVSTLEIQTFLFMKPVNLEIQNGLLTLILII